MKIKVVELGGTISSMAPSSTSEFYNSSKSSINSLLNELPINGIQIVSEILLQVISHEITADDLLKLAKNLQLELNKTDTSGVVVTVGTNALEDIAYFIGLVVNTEKPIVFTGAHFPQNSLAFDGKRNLYNAIIIASSKEAVKLGVLVTFNDYVVSARDATKTTPGLINNFSYEGNGIVGHVISNRFIKKMTPIYKHTYQSEFIIDNISSLPKIALLYAHLNMDDWLVKAAINANISGIISAGFGKGYQTKSITKVLCEAAQTGIIVVRCSRSGIGHSGRDELYDGKARFIVANELSPQKASLLLSIALTKKGNYEWLQNIFDGY